MPKQTVTRSVATYTAITAVLTCAAACDSDVQRGLREEAELAITAFDLAQRADVGARSTLLDALAAVPCTQEEICRFRTQCSDALRTLEDAQRALTQLQRDVANPTPPADAVAAQVIATEAQIRASQTSAEACVTERGALARRYDVR